MYIARKRHYVCMKVNEKLDTGHLLQRFIHELKRSKKLQLFKKEISIIICQSYSCRSGVSWAI